MVENVPYIMWRGEDLPSHRVRNQTIRSPLSSVLQAGDGRARASVKPGGGLSWSAMAAGLGECMLMLCLGK